MFKNQADAIDWIQGARYKGQKNGLDNTLALLSELNNPERLFKCIHIAGTNGKGSTAAYTERALRESGVKTGLYTSPYLIKYNERVQVNGVPIDEKSLVDITNLLEEKANSLVLRGIMPTTFELGTALAFVYFARMGVETAVVEVGLGGRLDSTNVISPEVSMIAAIGLDHVKILGGTVEEIAFEKAGIIKPHKPVVVQEQPENIMSVFREIADERASKITIAKTPDIVKECAYGSEFIVDNDTYTTTLCGRHQLKNASLAISALRLLGVKQSDIATGIAKAKWPCRLEWVSSALIDGSHNPQGASVLREYLVRFFCDKKIILVTGMMKDKQIKEYAEIIAPVVDMVIATAVDEPRAAAPDEIMSIYAGLGVKAITAKSVPEAVNMAMGMDGVKVFAGSLYIAGAVRAYLAGDDCFAEVEK